MTRYGFAIKALPKGGKPFGDEDDDTEDAEGTEDASLETADPDVSEHELSEDPGEDLPEDPTATPAAPTDDPAAAPEEDTAAPPAPDGPPQAEDDAGEDPGAAPQQPDDDSRPWAGDLYDEGDESDPEAAFAAYTGVDGEQAWLDQDPDGTLTGWVRDSTGQVWRYTDPDAWAADVDGAQMTRTHSRAHEGGDPAAPGASPPAPAAGGRGVQDSMFQSL
ncbi:hypothetical protein [Streptomyces longispororuber]|uniref:hypothetical protein n=1 Tax=Streptomyces longispororuber TaxID=68230 RepID=UPI0036FB3FD9